MQAATINSPKATLDSGKVEWEVLCCCIILLSGGTSEGCCSCLLFRMDDTGLRM
jgi:hypothetical protein